MRRHRTIRTPPVIPGSKRGTKCALAEGGDRKINLERELHQRQPATTSAKKPQTSRFLQAFRVHAGLGPYPANGRKVHYTASFPPNRSGGVSPAALMRQARGLTRTSARLPCWQAPAPSYLRKSRRSSWSWCEIP